MIILQSRIKNQTEPRSVQGRVSANSLLGTLICPDWNNDFSSYGNINLEQKLLLIKIDNK